MKSNKKLHYRYRSAGKGRKGRKELTGWIFNRETRKPRETKLLTAKIAKNTER